MKIIYRYVVSADESIRKFKLASASVKSVLQSQNNASVTFTVEEFSGVTVDKARTAIYDYTTLTSEANGFRRYCSILVANNSNGWGRGKLEK